MTDTNNGWPDRPGVPRDPEKDGWHWLRSSNGELIAAKYFAANENGWPEWPTWRGGQSPEIARTARFHAYIGPCLTPDEATALQKKGCARDQNTTQFCAEAAALQARVAELEGVLLEARDDLTEWIDFAHQSHIMQDFENDMEIVRRIDAALERKKE